MTDPVAAAIALGLLSGVALIAVLQRRARSIRKPPTDSTALRLRAVRRSRVAKVEQRVEALERALSQRAAPDHRGRVQGSPRPIADGDAIAALLALGYRRSEAVARLAAISDGGSTEERVRAALQAR